MFTPHTRKDSVMEYSKVIDHTMDAFEVSVAEEVYGAIQDASNGTDRSAQQRENRLGMSNIGHCQQAAVLMIRQTKPSDVRDKSAAFFGTVAGAAIEQRLKITHPNWLFQAEVEFRIPSGGELGAHPDIIIPATAAVSKEQFLANEAARVLDPTIPKVYVQGVWDLKSKDKLDTIKKYGPSKQQVFQLSGYAAAAIDAGLLDGSQPIFLTDAYFDRSGAQHESYSFGWWYDPNVLTEIDDWIHDVKYAVINGIDGSRDMAREWCWNWCEYATTCRGADTDVEGLIEDAEILSAVDLYSQGMALEREGKRQKDVAKLSIPEQLSGSTGTHNVRWVEVGATEIKGFTRAGHRKLTISPVPGPKKPPAPRKKKAAAVETEVQ